MSSSSSKNNNNNDSMMFDLNIDIAVPNNNDKEKEANEGILEGSGTNTELSGSSSTSSIVNESPISGTELDFFPPDAKFFAESSSSFITRQLFPITKGDRAAADEGGGGGERELDLLRFGSSTSSSHHQWLNLAVSGSGSGSGLDIGPDQQPTNKQQQVRRSRRGPRSRSSQYRGVTFYRRTGRWESHIWDCGKQVYLGGFDTAHAAATAYDRAAIKFRGVDADINFNIADYEEDMKQMKNLTKEEFVHILRRQSTGFSRGSSRYRGVTLHKCGRWEARMGQFLGKKAYDKAAIQCNGREAVTNFEPSSHEGQIHQMQPHNGGVSGHNLDLNLGISIPIHGPKASNNNLDIGESQAYHSSLQLANGKRPMNGSSACCPSGAQPLYGQPLASRQSPSTWSGSLPGRSETYEEKVASDQHKLETNSSARSLSNWAWYMQSQGQGGGEGGGSGGLTTQVQLLSSAASSGFSFSTTTNPSSSAATFPFSNPQSSKSFHHYNGLDRS